MITAEMILAAIGTMAGLSALCVVVTQALKNLCKTTKRWQNHLISFLTCLVLCFCVLAIGLWGHAGMWQTFDPHNWLDWIYWVCSILGCTLVSNGMWSYDIMKKFLELIKLIKPDTAIHSK